jgi:hypothetical protein
VIKNLSGRAYKEPHFKKYITYSFIVVEAFALAGSEGKGGLRPLLCRLFLAQ